MRHVLLALATLCFVLPVSADDWPRFRGPKGDGHSAETGLLASWPAGGPKKLFSVGGLGVGWSSTAIVGDNIYVTGMEGGRGLMWCFDTKGKQKWKVDYGREWSEGGRMKFPGAHCTPTVDNGHIYLMSGYGVASCWKAEDGTKVWEVDTFAKYGGRNIFWGISESPLVHDNAVYVTPGGPGASVVKLDKTSGKLIWKTGSLSETSAYCSPIMIKGVLVTMLANNVVGIDPADGKALWSVPHKNKYSVHANTPLLSESGLLFCASGYGQGSLAIELGQDAKTGKLVWSKKIMDTHFGGIVIVGDTAYGTSSYRPRGQLLALDVKTGEVKAKTKALRKGTIIAAEGKLYGYEEKTGKVVLIQPTDGGFKELGSFVVDEGKAEHWAHLAIANGVLYVRHGTHLIAYDIKKK